MIHGIDTSSWQGEVDWPLVRRAGARFAAIKASEGAYPDPQIGNSWPHARAAGLLRMAYCFFHPDQDVQTQVNVLHQAVRNAGRFLRGDAVMLDLETTGRDYPLQVVQQAENFVRAVRRDIAKPVILYSGYYFLNEIGAGNSRLLTSLPLCVPSYGAEPRLPAGFPLISFWQYSGTGHWPGVSTAVDLDIFYGNMVQLKKVLGA